MAKQNRRQQGEGSVYQRRDGRWVASVNLGWKEGKRDRRSFYGATPDEARGRRDDFLAKRRDGFTLPKGRPPTVAEWATWWLHAEARESGTVQDTTWPSYRSRTERHIVPFFARVPLTADGITEELVREWHAHLKRAGLSPTTVQHCHRLLSQMLNLAVRRGRLMRNPARDVHPPPRSTVEPMPPEEDEVHQLLLACEDLRSGPPWVTALATGGRVGEILGLTWPLADIDDLGNASVSIEWELVRLPWRHGCEDPHGCGEGRHRFPCPVPCPKAARTSGRPHTCTRDGGQARDSHGNAGRPCPPGCEGHASSCPQRTGGGLVLKRPKSAKSIRTVPIGRMSALALKRQRQQQLEERLALGPDWRGWAHECARKPRRRDVVCPDCRMPYRADALVFTQADGRPVDPRADYGDWLDLLAACGLDHYRRHDQRHHVATSLLEGGTDIRVVQEIMGHATPDFTRRAYQHVRAPLKRQAADVLGERMWGKR